MAKKKKRSTSPGAATRKALAGIEKAQKALLLNIKNLRKAMGHPHTSRAQGHPPSAASRVKGHPHSAR
jgi:hypothetical protein